MVEATITEVIARPEVPFDMLETLLRAYVDDPTAVITSCATTPLSDQGTNDSTTLLRATFSWMSAKPFAEPQLASWIMKHWHARGERDGTLGISQPLEVLAWEAGLLRPDALPGGLVVPIVGGWRSYDQREAWLALTDVTAELSLYGRMSLSGDAAVASTRAILRRLARFHAMWEEPEQQARLAACSWLRRSEATLWNMAATYAHALGRKPLAPAALGGPPLWDGLSADLEAFLEARPADERRLWETLLVDRGALVAGLASYPQTLLHNDLDDRNIGLHGLADEVVELVLIDWEWIGQGPAALDVANLVQRVPIIIAPGQPIPESIWADEFADAYFAYYRAAGGRCVDAATWRRAYGLALVAQGLNQMPFIHGSARRAMRGDTPPPKIIGIPPAVVRQILRDGLPVMERMEQRVIGEARRWLM